MHMRFDAQIALDGIKIYIFLNGKELGPDMDVMNATLKIH